MFNSEHNSLEAARNFDAEDALKDFRSEFEFPKDESGQEFLYFAGHSLGLMPKQTREYMNIELDAWAKKGVEGHMEGDYPWLPYHENITESFATLVGAKSKEVVAMNTLTVNLHLMMVSFYRPTKTKYKILIENNTFPSDKYAVDSQARFHGFDPSEAIIELKPEPGKLRVEMDQVLEQIRVHGDSLALVMLGNCNYLSGQCFDMEAITKLAHEYDCMVGFNLAHGTGNIKMQLHDWDVDFAVWCSYKYLNSGPGSLAGAFVHERHLGLKDINRFEGWWGTNKKERFQMKPDFDPIPTAEAWQLSNPPIFPLAAMRSSMDIFNRATMDRLIQKRDHLTSYMEWLVKENCGSFITVETPEFSETNQSRGAMLSVRVSLDGKKLVKKFKEKKVIIDFREPDILRMAPAPLYNSYEDVYGLVKIIEEVAHESK